MFWWTCPAMLFASSSSLPLGSHNPGWIWSHLTYWWVLVRQLGSQWHRDIWNYIAKKKSHWNLTSEIYQVILDGMHALSSEVADQISHFEVVLLFDKQLVTDHFDCHKSPCSSLKLNVSLTQSKTLPIPAEQCTTIGFFLHKLLTNVRTSLQAGTDSGVAWSGHPAYSKWAIVTSFSSNLHAIIVFVTFFVPGTEEPSLRI
jgi:hypothetical protein